MGPKLRRRHPSRGCLSTRPARILNAICPNPRNHPEGFPLMYAVAFAVAALVTLAGCATPEDIEARQASIDDDVSVTGCVVDPVTLWMRADVTVKNDSTDRSNYIVEVAFEDPTNGNQLATDSVFVNALESGQTAVDQAQPLTEPPFTGFTCRVVDVTRTSDEP